MVLLTGASSGADALPQSQQKSQQKSRKLWTRMSRVGITALIFEHVVYLSSGSNMSEARNGRALSRCYGGYLTNADAVKAACHT